MAEKYNFFPTKSDADQGGVGSSTLIHDAGQDQLRHQKSEFSQNNHAHTTPPRDKLTN